MKKYLLVLTVLISLLFSVTTYATEVATGEKMVPTFTFSSVERFREYAENKKYCNAKCNAYDLFEAESAFADKYYLIAPLYETKIVASRVQIYNTYLTFDYLYNKISYTFGYYHDLDVGNRKYKIKKELFEEYPNKFERQIFTVDGKSVYTEKIAGRREYYWFSDEHYFFVSTKNDDVEADKLLASEKSFSISKRSESLTLSEIDGKTKCVDENGEFLTGWRLVGDEKWHRFFKSNGEMVSDCSYTIGEWRYYFDENGKLSGYYTGWTKSSLGRRYFLNGKMQVGEVTIGKKVYTFDGDGYLI